MLKLEIKITGKTLSDLETALDEVKRAVLEGFTAASNRNEDGNYTFIVREEEDAYQLHETVAPFPVEHIAGYVYRARFEDIKNYIISWSHGLHTFITEDNVLGWFRLVGIPILLESGSLNTHNDERVVTWSKPEDKNYIPLRFEDAYPGR